MAIAGGKIAEVSRQLDASRASAVAAGKLADVPVMVDFGDFRPERPFERLWLAVWK